MGLKYNSDYSSVTDLNVYRKCCKQTEDSAEGDRDFRDRRNRVRDMDLKFNKMCSSFLPIFMSLFVIFLSAKLCDGFNIDTASKVEFQGPNPGSYYGYSVAMLNQGNSDKWLLIGAPKDNSTFLRDVKNPGAVYKCTLTISGHSCEELFVDDQDGTDSAQFDGITKNFVHGRDDQWLGASLDVNENAGIVTCASRWYNKHYETKGYFFMNGLCYEIPLDFNRANIKKIPALVDGTKQTTTTKENVTKLNYGMGGLGASVHYSDQGVDLLLGAPGLHTWTGGFVDLRADDSYILQYNERPAEISEMAGYAMTSGNYFGMPFFAIGAPRDHLVGKVFLFSADHKNYILENADFTLDGSDLIEVPVNGFFGGALCSVDVNNDGMDDLMIAAPFYSKGVKDDTGVVFVYLGNRNELKFKPQSTLLTGSDTAGARFGSSIANLGDINKDGYNDVVIGAPYEDNGQGAIYVYNGCRTGLWPSHSQKIEAATISPGLLSFGISFSKAEDMNDDNLNDIAVGAYLSDKAFLLYGQYVIGVDIQVDATVQQIDKDTSEQCPSIDGQSMVPCFKVKACFNYEARAYSPIDVIVILKLDMYMGDYNRIMFQNGQNTMSSPERIFSSMGDKYCTRPENVLIKSTSDLVTPVRIEASYDVVDIASSGGILPTVNKFDGSDPSKQLLISWQRLEFKKDCPNNECHTDLHLTAETIYDRFSNDYYIIGTSTLALDVSIAKSGDPSYSSNFFVAFPNSLQFQKVTKIHGDTEMSCGFVADDDSSEESDDMQSLEYLQRQNIPEKSKDEMLMMCGFGNPMSNDTGVRFHLHFYVPHSVNSTSLTFRLNATTLSTERQPTDNVKTIKVEVRNKVTTTFMGVSRPSYTTIREKAKSYVVSHVYEMRNKGPSPLPAASLMIQYPQIQRSGRPLLFLNITSWSCPPPCRIQCSYPDSDNTAPVVYAAHIGPTYVVNEDSGDENVGESRTISNMKNINCNDAECSRYECELYDIPARESAVVELEYVAMGDILAATSDGDALTIRSKAYVSLKQLNRLIYDTKEHYTNVGTDLLPVSPPPQKVAWWIYLVSILAGILLIIIVILILWRCGFFKRKSVEEMKRMQHSGEVQKMIQDKEEGNNVKS